MKSAVLKFYLLALAIASAMVALTYAMHATTVIADLVRWLQAHNRYANIINIAWYGIAARQPMILRVFFFAGAPTIAALLVTARSGTSDLLSTLRPWRGGVSQASAGRTYAAIFAVYFAVLGGYYWITASAGKSNTVLGDSVVTIVLFALLGAFVDEGGTLEELGWRGFAFPRLQQSMGSPLWASVFLGVIWTAWHLPREVPALVAGVDWSQWLSNQAQFVLLCVALSIVSGYLVNRTGGSVIPAILVHGGSNVWSKAVGAVPNEMFHTDVRTVIVVAIAVLILVFTNFRKPLPIYQP